MISRALCLMILVIISSFHIVRLSRAMAQTPSEGAKVLVDDVIQALKANDTNKVQVHLSILNQQLPTFVNSTSLESVKVLLDDVSSALKNNDINNALIHLNLVKQQLTPNGNNTITPSPLVKEAIPSVASSQIANVQANHPPKAYDQNVFLISSGILKKVELKGDDADGDPITFSIKSNPTHGTIDVFNSTSGVLIFNPTTGNAGNDSFTYQVIDNRGAASNIAQVSIGVGNRVISFTRTIRSAIAFTTNYRRRAT
jgi:Big-like domain-containing protein